MRADKATAQDLFGDQGDTKHIVKGNFVWSLPTLKSENKTLQGRSGWSSTTGSCPASSRWTPAAPYDIGYSYQSGGGTNLTGSPDYNARIVIPNLGAVGSGCT